MTPPTIERTSILSGSYTLAGTGQTDFTVYTNEPADCRWNTNDTDYKFMPNTMKCSPNGFDTKSIYYGLYECKTSLTDVADGGEQSFYIRCMDKSANKNVNTESHIFTLKGTGALVVSTTGPTGTFYKSDVTLIATTTGGAEDGISTCYFGTSDQRATMAAFFTTGSTSHEQPLVFTDLGDYTYYIECEDIAGNKAKGTAKFGVNVDLSPPSIVYIYVEGSTLHMELSEPSTCEYDTKSFTYGSGQPMTGTDTTVHELTVGEKLYFIKCIDAYKNEAQFTVYP